MWRNTWAEVEAEDCWLHTCSWIYTEESRSEEAPLKHWFRTFQAARSAAISAGCEGETTELGWALWDGSPGSSSLRTGAEPRWRVLRPWTPRQPLPRAQPPGRELSRCSVGWDGALGFHQLCGVYLTWKRGGRFDQADILPRDRVYCVLWVGCLVVISFPYSSLSLETISCLLPRPHFRAGSVTVALPVLE